MSETTDDMTLKRIRINLPSGMAAKLGALAKKRGVTRQELIKIWLGDRLETVAWGHVNLNFD